MPDVNVVARFKGSSENGPRFTKTATLEELLTEVAKAIPVDMLYIVTPYPSGGGYSLHEIGLLTLDIRDPQGRPIATSSLSRPDPLPETPPAKTVQEPLGEEISIKPTPSLPPPPKDAPQVILGQDTGFSFERPKSQAELLKERGIVEPRQRVGRTVADETPGEPEPPLRKKAKPGKLSKRKSKELSDDDLPHVRSSSHTEIANIITATPAQAAAASKFGKH